MTEVEELNRRLLKLIEQEEKAAAQIMELQETLKKLREMRKAEEDQQIIRSIRSLKLGGRELIGLLSAIENGTLSDEMKEQLLSLPEPGPEKETVPAQGEELWNDAGDDTGSFPEGTKKEKHMKRDADGASEREEENDTENI